MSGGGAAAVSRFLFLTIAGLAVLLASTGLPGAIAWSVSQRPREIGVRVALGASPGNLLTMILGEGVRLAAIGVTVGIAGAYTLSRALASLLYGVGPTDLLSYGLAAALLLGVAALAAYVPARRATRVDPLVALRAD